MVGDKTVALGKQKSKGERQALHVREHYQIHKSYPDHK